MTDQSFIDWMLPGAQTTKEPEIAEKAKEPEQEIPNNPAKGDEPHMKLGAELAKFGVKPRAKDADGLGPQVSGSPWVADVSDLDAIFQGLRKMGYLSKLPKASMMTEKKGASFRKPQQKLMVDMGRDSKNVYLYIYEIEDEKK